MKTCATCPERFFSEARGRKLKGNQLTQVCLELLPLKWWWCQLSFGLLDGCSWHVTVTGVRGDDFCYAVRFPCFCSASFGAQLCCGCHESRFQTCQMLQLQSH